MKLVNMKFLLLLFVMTMVSMHVATPNQSKKRKKTQDTCTITTLDQWFQLSDEQQTKYQKVLPVREYAISEDMCIWQGTPKGEWEGDGTVQLGSSKKPDVRMETLFLNPWTSDKHAPKRYRFKHSIVTSK